MKKRQFTAALIILITLLGTMVSTAITNNDIDTYIYIIGSYIIISALIYWLYGMPRLVVYSIYWAIILGISFSIHEDYRLMLILILTVVIVINPLSGFEHSLDKKLSPSATETFKFNMGGRYKTFYLYKKQMTDYYHLPQTRKLFTKPLYKFFRTFFVVTLFTALIFLLIYTTNDIIRLQGINDINILSIYFQIVIAFLIILLHKRGFTTMFRLLRIAIFLPIIYLIIMSGLDDLLKYSFVALFVIGFIGLVVTETLLTYTRVDYNAYNYIDPITNHEVFANALYEPFIYNEDRESMVKFSIDSSKDVFVKNFKELLVYANVHRFILTAYTYNKGSVDLYVEFYNKKQITKASKKLETIFKSKTNIVEIADPLFYEKTFLHNHEYIITRALTLAHLLKDLEIKDEVIISTSMYFTNIDSARTLFKKYNINLLENKTDYCLLEINISVKNIDFMIEQSLRDVLLDMLVNGGTFVRVMVYY